MKKIIATLSLSITALLVVFVLQYNSGAKTTEEAMTIAGLSALEVLYEKKTEEGSILLYRVPGEEQISLAFLDRSFSGYEYIDGSIQYETTTLEEQAGLTYVALRQSDDIPYTIYAGVTKNPDLFEVLVNQPLALLIVPKSLNQPLKELISGWLTRPILQVIIFH